MKSLKAPPWPWLPSHFLHPLLFFQWNALQSSSLVVKGCCFWRSLVCNRTNIPSVSECRARHRWLHSSSSAPCLHSSPWDSSWPVTCGWETPVLLDPDPHVSKCSHILGEGAVWGINKCFSECLGVYWDVETSCEKSHLHHFHFITRIFFRKHSEIREKNQADTEG